MIGLYYLLAYEGGAVQLGDDRRDARSQWWSLEELSATTVRLHPSTQLWMLHRAVVLYRLWHDQPPVPLQPALDPEHGSEA